MITKTFQLKIYSFTGIWLFFTPRRIHRFVFRQTSFQAHCIYNLDFPALGWISLSFIARPMFPLILSLPWKKAWWKNRRLFDTTITHSRFLVNDPRSFGCTTKRTLIKKKKKKKKIDKQDASRVLGLKVSVRIVQLKPVFALSSGTTWWSKLKKIVREAFKSCIFYKVNLKIVSFLKRSTVILQCLAQI